MNLEAVIGLLRVDLPENEELASRPDSMIDEVRLLAGQRVESMRNTHGDRFLEEAVTHGWDIFGQMDHRDVNQRLKELQGALSPRARSIYRLLARADALVPNCHLLLQRNVVAVGAIAMRSLAPLLELMKALDGYTAGLEECRSAEEYRRAGAAGEPLARASYAVLADTLNDSYEAYARRLWFLHRLLSGEAMNAGPGAFGSLVKQLSDSSHVGSLVHPDAAHIRNAVSHPHRRYYASDHRVRLWERDRKWERHYEVIEIAEIAIHLQAAFSDMNAALGLRSLRGYVRSMMPYRRQIAGALAGQATPDVLRGVQNATRKLERVPAYFTPDLLEFSQFEDDSHWQD